MPRLKSAVRGDSTIHGRHVLMLGRCGPMDQAPSYDNPSRGKRTRAEVKMRIMEALSPMHRPKGNNADRLMPTATSLTAVITQTYCTLVGCRVNSVHRWYNQQTTTTASLDCHSHQSNSSIYTRQQRPSAGQARGTGNH